MTTQDDYSPVTQGDTLKRFNPHFTTTDGNGKTVPYPLSGLTLSMVLVSEAGEVKAGQGTYSVIDAANGLAQYHYDAADVDTPGLWNLITTFTDGSGETDHAQPKPLEIEARKVPS